MSQSYEYMKPRLFYSRKDKSWICADVAGLTEFVAVRAYYELGKGATPKEAWDSAYPPSAITKLKNWIKSCLNRMNT